MSSVFVFLVVLIHVWFFIFETFLWTKPIALKLMNMTQDEATQNKILAMNQGLYNLMVAAFLGWSFVRQDLQMTWFILVTIVLAGIFGAVTAKRPQILFIQSIPGIFALMSLP